MSKKTDQSDSTDSGPFDVSEEDIAAATKTVQAQIRNAFGMWAASFEVCNVLVRQWTESRRKALEHAMRELAKADKEPDLEKRAQMVAKVFTEQTNSALTDVLAASTRAVHVGAAHSQRVMAEAMRSRGRVEGAIREPVMEANHPMRPESDEEIPSTRRPRKHK